MMDTLERLEALLERYHTLVEERRKRIEQLEEDNKRLQGIVDISHEYIRNALRLEKNAPLRFDYYAQEIERLREVSSEFTNAMELMAYSSENLTVEKIINILNPIDDKARSALQQGDVPWSD